MVENRNWFRPAGLREAEAILATDGRPPPAPRADRPRFERIFSREAAEEVARRWNCASPACGWAGFVVRLALDFRFAVRIGMEGIEAEPGVHWIASDVYHAAVTPPFDLVSVYFGRGFRGSRGTGLSLKGLEAAGQITRMEGLSRPDLGVEMVANRVCVQINFEWWARRFPASPALPRIREIWTEAFPDRRLIGFGGRAG